MKRQATDSGGKKTEHIFKAKDSNSGFQNNSLSIIRQTLPLLPLK